MLHKVGFNILNTWIDQTAWMKWDMSVQTAVAPDLKPHTEKTCVRFEKNIYISDLSRLDGHKKKSDMGRIVAKKKSFFGCISLQCERSLRFNTIRCIYYLGSCGEAR